MTIKLRPLTSADEKLVAYFAQNTLYFERAGFPQLSGLRFKEFFATYVQQDRVYVVEIPSLTANLTEGVGLIELNTRGVSPELQGSFELGFVLKQAYWHQGIMMTALNLLLQQLRLDGTVRELWASHYEDNHASQHMLTKIGFNYRYTVEIPFSFNFKLRKQLYYQLKFR